MLSYLRVKFGRVSADRVTNRVSNGKRLQPSPRPSAVRQAGTIRPSRDGDAPRNRADARRRAAPPTRDGARARTALPRARLYARLRPAARLGDGRIARRGVLRAERGDGAARDVPRGRGRRGPGRRERQARGRTAGEPRAAPAATARREGAQRRPTGGE